jgi:hypothetical protein
VDRVDDLGRIDPWEISAGDAEVRVANLALDHGQWDAFPGHLDRVRMT